MLKSTLLERLFPDEQARASFLDPSPNIIICGLPRSGKTSISKVVFQGTSPHETLYLPPDTAPKVISVQHSRMMNLTLVDLAGAGGGGGFSVPSTISMTDPSAVGSPHSSYSTWGMSVGGEGSYSPGGPQYYGGSSEGYWYNPSSNPPPSSVLGGGHKPGSGSGPMYPQYGGDLHSMVGGGGAHGSADMMGGGMMMREPPGGGGATPSYPQSLATPRSPKASTASMHWGSPGYAPFDSNDKMLPSHYQQGGGGGFSPLDPYFGTPRQSGGAYPEHLKMEGGGGMKPFNSGAMGGNGGVGKSPGVGGYGNHPNPYYSPLSYHGENAIPGDLSAAYQGGSMLPSNARSVLRSSAFSKSPASAMAPINTSQSPNLGYRQVNPSTPSLSLLLDPAYDEVLFPMTAGIIFVIDAQNDPYASEILNAKDIFRRAWKCNPDINLEVFIHKIDGDLFSVDEVRVECQRDIHDKLMSHLHEEGVTASVRFYSTSIYDNTIYEACSKMYQRLVSQVATCCELLDILASKCKIEKAFLVDSMTKIFIATDNSQFDPFNYELCFELIELISEFISIYASDTECNMLSDTFYDQASPYLSRSTSLRSANPSTEADPTLPEALWNEYESAYQHAKSSDGTRSPLNLPQQYHGGRMIRSNSGDASNDGMLPSACAYPYSSYYTSSSSTHSPSPHRLSSVSPGNSPDQKQHQSPSSSANTHTQSKGKSTEYYGGSSSYHRQSTGSPGLQNVERGGGGYSKNPATPIHHLGGGRDENGGGYSLPRNYSSSSGSQPSSPIVSSEFGGNHPNATPHTIHLDGGSFGSNSPQLFDSMMHSQEGSSARSGGGHNTHKDAGGMMMSPTNADMGGGEGSGGGGFWFGKGGGDGGNNSSSSLRYHSSGGGKESGNKFSLESTRPYYSGGGGGSREGEEKQEGMKMEAGGWIPAGKEREMTRFPDPSAMCTVQLNTGHFLYLRQIDPRMVLACVIREENFDRQFLIDYNIRILQKAVLGLFGYGV